MTARANAVGESWFATLKEELIYQRLWATIAQVRRAVIEFIEIFYNRQRFHGSLGYLAPVEFEQKIHQHPPPGGGTINLSVKPGQPHREDWGGRCWGQPARAGSDPRRRRSLVRALATGRRPTTETETPAWRT